MAVNSDGVIAEVSARETEVMSCGGAVGIEEIAVLVEDVLIEADLLAGEATEILAKATKAGVPLFEDDGLGFDFTDGFSDNPGRSICQLGRIIGKVKSKQTSWPSLE